MTSYVGIFYIARGEMYCNKLSCLCGLSHSNTRGNITLKKNMIVKLSKLLKGVEGSVMARATN